MPRPKSEPESAFAPPSIASNHFPIVGVGASAGGLEALEQFLRPVPTDSGMAFVIVQHLDPTHPALLTELLQRTTGLMVEQVIDRVKVQPNHVYVIPPNHDLSLLHGSLHLFEPSAPRGLRLPIDLFFRSLVEDQQERSIGIVLSGMGSDGALGLKAIKEVGGVTLVQEPSTAKFDAMPRNAIDAHLADIIAPPEKLYELLATHLGHAINHQDLDHTINHQDLGHTTNHYDPSTLDPVVILLRTHSGHDFSQYIKKHSVPPNRTAHGSASTG